MKQKLLIFACILSVTLALWAANTTLTNVALKNGTIDNMSIGATTPSTGVFTGVTSTTLTANGSVANGTAIKHFRTSGTSCTANAPAGTTCTTGAISFPGSAFPDTNYTVICQVGDASNVATPIIVGVTSKTTTSVALIVTNFGTNSSYGNADCIAFHD